MWKNFVSNKHKYMFIYIYKYKLNIFRFWTDPHIHEESEDSSLCSGKFITAIIQRRRHVIDKTVNQVA